MDITVRDILMGLGMLLSGVSTYVLLDRRVTRLEAIEQRMEKVEDAIVSITDKATTSGEAMARMATTLEAQGAAILKLESAVSAGNDGIAQVLAELRSRKGNA